MKKLEAPQLLADPVMTEVRRAKTALAQKHGFDVAAMVRGNPGQGLNSTACKMAP